MIYSIEHLKRDLSIAGIVPGDTLLVHSSMKSIGTVENRADGVLAALMETVTSDNIYEFESRFASGRRQGGNFEKIEKWTVEK